MKLGLRNDGTGFRFFHVRGECMIKIPNELIQPLEDACRNVETVYLPKYKQYLNQIYPLITRFDERNKNFYYHKVNALFTKRFIEIIDIAQFLVHERLWEDLDIYSRVIWEILFSSIFLNFGCERLSDISETARLKGDLYIICSELFRISKEPKREDPFRDRIKYLKANRIKKCKELDLDSSGDHWYGYKRSKLIKVMQENRDSNPFLRTDQEDYTELSKHYNRLSLAVHVDLVSDLSLGDTEPRTVMTYSRAKSLLITTSMYTVRIAMLYRFSLLGELERLFFSFRQVFGHLEQNLREINSILLKAQQSNP